MGLAGQRESKGRVTGDCEEILHRTQPRRRAAVVPLLHTVPERRRWRHSRSELKSWRPGAPPEVRAADKQLTKVVRGDAGT